MGNGNLRIGPGASGLECSPPRKKHLNLMCRTSLNNLHNVGSVKIAISNESAFAKGFFVCES
jgi:hypothetical protein